MAIYELKPPVVDAIQWTGDNVDEMLSFGYQFFYIQTGHSSWIEFRDNAKTIRMNTGDYIVYKANENTLSVMDKAMFEAQYKLKDYLR